MVLTGFSKVVKDYDKLERWQLRIMQHKWSIVHGAGIKEQPIEAQSRLPTKRTHEYDINDDITVITSTTHVQKYLNEFSDSTPENTKIETNEPNILTFSEFINAQGTEPYWSKIGPTVGISSSSFIFI